MNEIFPFPLAIPAIIFVFGACVGSFLNVCIYRIPARQSIISPGSHCPRCETPIPIYLNIPVLSFIILRGRCSFCGTKISSRYPAVEALTGILALALFHKFGPTIPFLFWFCFGAVLVTITFIDIDHQIIPDRISLPGILVFASSAILIPGMSLKACALGILVGGGIPLALAQAFYLIRKQEGLGGGDIKLMAMIGAATGISGVLFTLFTGSLAGTIYGVCQGMGKNRSGQVRIPFGPFLSFGALVYIFQGHELISWYLSLVLH